MIELRNLTKKKISKKRIDDIARAFFKKYKISPEVEISLAIVSDTKMKEINSIYRGKDKTTDVLSFPELNEIIISLSQIERQAKESGRRIWQEFDFILVHGLLHLIGYTDEEEKDRLKMIKLGEDFLQDFKKAFTLIEMMIVLFIVGLLSSIIIANYNVGYSTTDLVNSQTTVQQNLKLAQSYALNSKPYNGTIPTYWGMGFLASSQKIYLFADLNGNYLPDSGEMDAVYGGKEIVLPGGLTFRNSFDIATVTALFVPGSGEMVAYDSDSESLNYLEWRVEISDKHFNIGKVVVFQPGYLIDNASCSCDDASVACCSFCGAGSSCNNIEWVCGLPIIDSRDSQQYPTVQIGTQCWMAKNLNIGTMVISKVGSVYYYQTNNSVIEKYCFNDVGSSCNSYGGLYQWDEAMQYSTVDGSQGICPSGWHIPTHNELTILTNTVDNNINYRCGGTSGNIAKSLASVSGWGSNSSVCSVGNDQSTNNSTNFNGVPGGQYSFSNGWYYDSSYYFYLWSSTAKDVNNSYIRYLNYSIPTVYSGYKEEVSALSVRCIKN